MTRRYTSTGQPWHAQPMPDRNRTRHDGSRFEPTDKPMSLRECIAWCGFISSMAGYAVSVMMGWVSNPVSWVMS